MTFGSWAFNPVVPMETTTRYQVLAARLAVEGSWNSLYSEVEGSAAAVVWMLVEAVKSMEVEMVADMSEPTLKGNLM